jgi:hypothetical protein
MTIVEMTRVAPNSPTKTENHRNDT